jgi:predicted helicase
MTKGANTRCDGEEGQPLTRRVVPPASSWHAARMAAVQEDEGKGKGEGAIEKGEIAALSLAMTKLDIFHYVYGLLHSPEYREKYSANLRLELPRIPMVKSAEDFWAFVTAGERLADLHVNYETQPEYKLEFIENPNEPLSWRVDKMRLSKDKTGVVYNGFLTLGGIPAQAFEYKLGTRSALEWVIERYQVMEDKRSCIVNDPNRADDPEYITRLIGQVITVSMETAQIVESLPGI